MNPKQFPEHPKIQPILNPKTKRDDTDRENSKYKGENLQKGHMEWPGIEPRTPQ
jgi:hypothetical protein